jgi:glucose/arabinose dehydrogenase
VGTRHKVSVYAVLDRNKDHFADEVVTVASGLHMPNGVAFRKGALYVAEVSRVLRFDNIESHLRNPPEPVTVNSSFPTDDHHGWKYIAFGPDDRLYVPVGAPCNVCERKTPVYASITRMASDGSGLEIFARGVRNTVGFDWQPQTKVLSGSQTTAGTGWEMTPRRMNSTAPLKKGCTSGFRTATPGG